MQKRRLRQVQASLLYQIFLKVGLRFTYAGWRELRCAPGVKRKPTMRLIWGASCGKTLGKNTTFWPFGPLCGPVRVRATGGNTGDDLSWQMAMGFDPYLASKMRRCVRP